jgi:hypothetical protein
LLVHNISSALVYHECPGVIIMSSALLIVFEKDSTKHIRRRF